jgi:hypothetical protein
VCGYAYCSVCIHVYARTFTYADSVHYIRGRLVDVFVCVYVNICLDKYIYLRTRTYACTHKLSSQPINMFVCGCMCVYIYINRYIYIYIYIYVCM